MKPHSKFKNTIKCIANELKIYFLHLFSKQKNPIVFISVSDGISGFSSELRGKNVVIELRRLDINTVFIPHFFSRSQRARLAALLRPDVIVHQKFRIGENDPELYPHSVNIVDLDDADFLDPKLEYEMEVKAKMCLGGIAGSRYTEKWLSDFVDTTTVIWTGTTGISMSKSLVHHNTASKTIVWAVTSPLDNRREAEFIRNIITKCALKRSFEFCIIGKANTSELREYFAPALKTRIDFKHIPFVPYNEFLSNINQCAIGLAPLFTKGDDFNSGKSFGKILGYVSSKVPVITTDAVDHSLFFTNGVNGYISNTEDDWVEKIIQLLDSPELRIKISDTAYIDHVNRLSIEEFTKRFVNFINRVYEKNRGVKLLNVK